MDDVLEMFMVGVSVVGVGMVNFIDLYICLKLIDGLFKWMEELGIELLE